MGDHSQAVAVPMVGRRSDDAIIAPDGSAVRLLLTQEHGATRCSVVEVAIPAGAVSRPVRHRTVEEVWYVVDGEGEVWRCPPDALPSAVAAVSVAPGDALTIPTSWAFQFKAGSSAGLRFICVTIPAWPGMDEAEEVAEGGLGPPTLAPP